MSGGSALASAQDQLILAAQCRFFDCLGGHPPQVPFRPLDPLDDRARALRDAAVVGVMVWRDPLARFWLRDLRFGVLFCAVLRQSAWARGQAEPVSIASLSQQSGLSAQSVGSTLLRAREAGDFNGMPAPQDRRRLVLEPSEQVRQAADLGMDGSLLTMARFCGMEPLPPLTQAVRLHWRRVFLDMSLTWATNLHRDAHFARRVFGYTLWDLLLADGTQRSASFIPAKATQLQVTEQTVRNEIAWLRAQGWLQAGEPLIPTPMARQRFADMLGLLDTRWRLELSVLSLLQQHPEIGPLLKVPDRQSLTAGW